MMDPKEIGVAIGAAVAVIVGALTGVRLWHNRRDGRDDRDRVPPTEYDAGEGPVGHSSTQPILPLRDRYRPITNGEWHDLRERVHGIALQESAIEGLDERLGILSTRLDSRVAEDIKAHDRLTRIEQTIDEFRRWLGDIDERAGREHVKIGELRDQVQKQEVKLEVLKSKIDVLSVARPRGR